MGRIYKMTPDKKHKAEPDVLAKRRAATTGSARRQASRVKSKTKR